MAAVTGIKGNISFAGQSDLTGGSGANQILANKWSSSKDRDTHDVTPFNAPSNARKNIGGLHVMTGTMEGFLDAAIGPDISHMTEDEIPAEFVLTATTGRTYTFNGILSNFSSNVDAQSPNTWSASFISDGPIAIG